MGRVIETNVKGLARRATRRRVETVHREIGANGNGSAQQAPKFSFDRRASGLLMHITSLPGQHGNGDLGNEARRFADFLHDAGQHWWQMLPVGPPGSGPGYSPYSACSAMAGSPFLVSLELLAKEGLLDADDLRPTRSLREPRKGHTNLAAAIAFREPRLRKAFERFKASGGMKGPRFREFCQREWSWLDDFALFSALRQAHDGAAWTTWPRELRWRKPEAIERARREHADEILYHCFVQFQFERQWSAFRAHCRARNVGLIGDIPIFVAHDSADVWASPDLFTLNRRSGEPTVVSGYPPDPFNTDGQRWGHPHFRWDVHRETDYEWWLRRFASMMHRFDAVRIDHFLGFHRCWAIRHNSPGAHDGRWIDGSGAGLFEAVRKVHTGAAIIAEDLGQLTPQASALRDQFHFPGMRVMQFAFGDGGDYHRPHTFPKRSVAYTGTHDNDTTVGWFEKLTRAARRSAGARRERQRALEYLGSEASNGRDVHWAMMRSLLMSPANTVIFPVQDILGLGTDARMNIPGTCEGNWSWRLADGALTPDVSRKMRRLCELYGRL